MTLDEYKLQSPEDDAEPTNTCDFCGNPTENTWFCNNDCELAYYND